MWHHDQTVVETYATISSENAWARIDSLGWLRIGPRKPDGVTNTFILLTTAKAHGRNVDVFIDSNQITRATLK